MDTQKVCDAIVELTKQLQAVTAEIHALRQRVEEASKQVEQFGDNLPEPSSWPVADSRQSARWKRAEVRASLPTAGSRPNVGRDNRWKLADMGEMRPIEIEGTGTTTISGCSGAYKLESNPAVESWGAAQAEGFKGLATQAEAESVTNAAADFLRAATRFKAVDDVYEGPTVYNSEWMKLCSRQEMPNVTPGEVVILHGQRLMVTEIKHGFVFFEPVPSEDDPEG